MKKTRIITTALLFAATLAGSAHTAALASADGWPPAHVWASDVRVHSQPDTSPVDVVGHVSAGWVPVECQKQGPTVTYGSYSSSWYSYVEIPDGHDTMGWISNVFITGPDKPSWIPVCDS